MTKIKEDKIFIFTDCASYHNNYEDKKGIAYYTIVNNKLEVLKDGFKAFNKSNNFCELYSILLGLTTILRNLELVDQFDPPIHEIEVVSDSEYCIKGFSERVRDWQLRGWKTKAKTPVKNIELWKKGIEIMDFAKEKGIELIFTHQKGHKGKKISKEENYMIYFQEQCDTNANKHMNEVLSYLGLSR